MRSKPLKLKPNGLGAIDAEIDGFAWEPYSLLDGFYRALTGKPHVVHVSDRYPVYPIWLGSVNGVVSYASKNVFYSVFAGKRLIWIKDTTGLYWISESEGTVDFKGLEKIMRSYGRSGPDFIIRGVQTPGMTIQRGLD